MARTAQQLKEEMLDLDVRIIEQQQEITDHTDHWQDYDPYSPISTYLVQLRHMQHYRDILAYRIKLLENNQ